MAIDLTGGLTESSEYVLAECPDDPEIRDAVNVWIEAADGTFGMRIGIEAVAEQWQAHDIWLDIAFADGRVFNYRKTGEPHPTLDEHQRSTIRGAGPLRFQCITPFKEWTASFKAMVAETNAEELAIGIMPNDPPTAEIEFNIEMSMAAPPWVPGSLLPEAGEVLTGKQGEFMSPRYEQLFRAKGSLRIGDDFLEVAGTGLRIRRQGVRRLDGFWGHCWQSAVFPNGKAFGYNTYPPHPDGRPTYNEGYIFDGSGDLKPARAVEIPWLDRLQGSGDNISFVLETEDGKVAIDGKTFINTRSVSKGSAVLPPDFPIVQQAHAHYQWDGEESCGMVERSSPKSKITS